MDLHTLIETFFNSINSVAKQNILGIPILIWLALFTVLFLVFAAMEKKMRNKP